MLFCEPIYKYPPLCGTLIKALTFIPKDIYLRDLTQPNPDKLSPVEDVLNDDASIPSQYIDYEEPSDTVKSEIENVFKEFGAYPPDILGKLLNPIVEKTVCSDNDEINLSLLKNTNLDFWGSDADLNRIISYIYQQ